MHSNSDSPPFVAELKPSSKLQHFIAVLHILALAASIINALPIVIRLLIAVLIGLSFVISLHKLKIEHRIIRYSEKRGWELSEGGDFAPVTILKSSVVTPLFIFLHIQNRPTLLVVNDVLSEDVFRGLIVKLKLTVSTT